MQDSKQLETDKGIYESPGEYIADELKKIDLILELAVLQQRIKKDVERDVFAGLYISEKEVDVLLNKAGDVKEKVKDTFKPPSDIMQLVHAIERQREIIAHRSDLAKKEGVVLPMEHLKRLFGLTPFEVDAVLLCLAPCLDTKYEKLYAYLQDDISKKYSTLNLIFMLLTRTVKESALARQCFSAQAPLIQWQILKFGDDKRELSVPPLSRPICIDERIVDFILGSPFLDPVTSESLEVIEPQGEIDTLYLREDLKQKLKHLTRRLHEDKEFRSNAVVFFHGPHGVGKTTAAIAISGALNIPLLKINIKNLLKNEETFFETVKRIVREALLLQCSLLVKGFDLLISDEVKISHFREYILKEVSTFSYLTFLTGKLNWESTIELDNARFIKIHFPVPDFLLRKQIWEKALNGKHNFAISLTPDDLADKFKFTEGQIRAAVATARDRTFFHPDDIVTDEDILTGCRRQNNQRLTELSLKVSQKCSWQDIVLPVDQLAQLKEICGHLKYRHIVYGEWGFDKKISSGKGLNVLFSGHSGTGKTMAAGILANELKLELYKIDLSQVVSKYIGETEKNLSRIFKEAETSNAILFFDEADALFGKRSEVKDAHDRYANIETGYLLQKMEEHEGVTILATNLRQNMDEAFVRRMQFIVDFPFPDKLHRCRIWKVHFPKEAPCGDDIDFEFLGRQFRLSGGNIRNIVINSSFLAAANSERIGMKHLIHATMREFQKMGKLCIKGDFGKYYELLELEAKI
ncbi:MAG TPA: ATP-binding protein [Nitrospirae bacterium]|nr:ATP-binding protein [Nitrospirota bacterium]